MRRSNLEIDLFDAALFVILSFKMLVENSGKTGTGLIMGQPETYPFPVSHSEFALIMLDVCILLEDDLLDGSLTLMIEARYIFFHLGFHLLKNILLVVTFISRCGLRV
jgi:hypothetical protein